MCLSEASERTEQERNKTLLEKLPSEGGPQALLYSENLVATQVLLLLLRSYTTRYLGVIVSQRLYLRQKEQAQNIVDHCRRTDQLANGRS